MKVYTYVGLEYVGKQHFLKKVMLGRFKTEREAYMAYNLAAIKYHGEFARLNQIQGVP